MCLSVCPVLWRWPCFSVFCEWKELRTSATLLNRYFPVCPNLSCHLDSVFDLYFNFFRCTFLNWSISHLSELNYYRMPTTLWKGNVFSHVCLSTGGRSHVTITHDRIGPHLTGTTPISWHVETCSNWTALRTHHPPHLSPSPPVQGALARLLPIRLTSGWFTSYWKAFLFTVILQAVAHLIGITQQFYKTVSHTLKIIHRKLNGTAKKNRFMQIRKSTWNSLTQNTVEA